MQRGLERTGVGFVGRSKADAIALYSLVSTRRAVPRRTSLRHSLRPVHALASLARFAYRSEAASRALFAPAGMPSASNGSMDVDHSHPGEHRELSVPRSEAGLAEAAGTCMEPPRSASHDDARASDALLHAAPDASSGGALAAAVGDAAEQPVAVVVRNDQSCNACQFRNGRQHTCGKRRKAAVVQPAPGRSKRSRGSEGTGASRSSSSCIAASSDASTSRREHGVPSNRSSDQPTFTRPTFTQRDRAHSRPRTSTPTPTPRRLLPAAAPRGAVN